MPIPDRTEWPKTVDGTTDWELLFENEETGLIAVVQVCASPEQLKRQTQAIIVTIFNRKRDRPIIAKITAYLDKLIPENAPEERMPTMQTGVQQLLRKVKDDRIKKAAAFVEKRARRRKHGSRKKKANRRTNPVIDFFNNNHAAMAALIFLLAALVPFGIYLGSPSKKVAEGNVNEHIGWIDNYVFNHLPQDTWVLQSVRQTKPSQIDVEILITDPEHIKTILGMRRIARVAILDQVCPNAGSGIKNILDKGWSLWITLNSPDEVLTGGTCHYK